MHFANGNERFTRSCIHRREHERDISRLNIVANFLHRQVTSTKLPSNAKADTSDNKQLQNWMEMNTISDRPHVRLYNYGLFPGHQFDRASDYNDKKVSHMQGAFKDQKLSCELFESIYYTLKMYEVSARHFQLTTRQITE